MLPDSKIQTQCVGVGSVKLTVYINCMFMIEGADLLDLCFPTKPMALQLYGCIVSTCESGQPWYGFWIRVLDSALPRVDYVADSSSMVP